MTQLNLFQQNFSNKVDSYYSEDVRDKELTQKERVYKAIEALGEASDREIAEYTNISISLIPDRRGKLLDANRITIAGTKRDIQTMKTVSTYKIQRGVSND